MKPENEMCASKLICPTLDYLKSQKKNKAEKATKERTSVEDKVRNKN